MNNKLYLPVEIKEGCELPEVEMDVVFIASKFGKAGLEGNEFIGYIDADKKWHWETECGHNKDFNNNPDYWQVTHWLKQVSLEEVRNYLARVQESLSPSVVSLPSTSGNSIEQRWSTTDAFIATCKAVEVMQKGWLIIDVNLLQDLLKEQGFSIEPINQLHEKI